MPTPPLTDEQCREALAAVARHHGSHQRAAEELGLKSVHTLKSRLRKASERGLTKTDPVMPGFRIARVSTTEDAGGAIKSRSIVQKPDTGNETFSITRGHSVKGVSALVDADGVVVQQWIKTREGERDPADIADEIKAAFTGFESRSEPAPAPATSDDDLAALYIIADAHLGLLSWKDEVGTNWDLKIARETIMATVSRLIDATAPASQAVVLGLGDLLHSDGYAPMTPQSKNVLDVDGRYPRTLQVATTLIIAMVTKALEKHANVLVRMLPGNHDPQSAIAVTLALSMFYSNEPRVTVDDDPSYYWWWRFGTTLLGATHGDAAKMKDLPLIMAARNPEDWGKSKFRQILTGHIHHTSSIEVSGVTVESFQTPSATDAWHHKQGYGAGRSMNSIVIHREHGEIARNKINVV